MVMMMRMGVSDLVIAYLVQFVRDGDTCGRRRNRKDFNSDSST